MQIIMLSGGSGKRLWPLSNSTRSKQFLKLLRAPDGGLESMVQRVFRQLGESGIDAPVTIATSVSQADTLRAQVGAAVSLVPEPQRRNTYPAVALACAYLAYEKHVPGDETVVVLPVDPYTERSYFETLPALDRAVRQSAADLVLMGIRPTGPSEKYGYIVPAGLPGGAWTQVARFTEKPSEAVAEALIAQGAVWNAGVFAFRLQWLLDTVAAQVPFTDYADLIGRYALLHKESFDYEIAEKTQAIAMIPYQGVWKDLGTWDAITEEMAYDRLGPCVTDGTVTSTHIINELGIPIVALGVDHLIIAASPDGILVADKAQSANLKTLVEPLDAPPLFAQERWGEYTVLARHEAASGMMELTRRLQILPGGQIGIQKHERRDLYWTVTQGEGQMWLNGQIRGVCSGDGIMVLRGTPYGLRAATGMAVVEVQLGTALPSDDTTPVAQAWPEG